MSSEASFKIPWCDKLKRSPTSGKQEVLVTCEAGVFPEAVLVKSVLVFLGRIIG